MPIRHDLIAWGLGAALLSLGCTPRGSEAELPGDAPPANPAVQGIFDPGAHGRGTPPPPLPQPPIAVLDYGPQGRTGGGGDLHIRFNQSVGALDLDASALQGVFAIDPPTPGVVRWRSPDLLVFVPAEPWLPAQRYTVRLAAPILAVDRDDRYEGPLEWSFETPRPRVEWGGAVTDDPERQHRRTAFFVAFDTPVSLAEARQHLRARARPRSSAELDRDDGLDLPGAAGAAAAPVAIRVERLTPALQRRHGIGDSWWEIDEKKGFLIAPRGLWPAASTITVEVTEGLQGELGPLALETPWRSSIATYGPQRLRTSSCGGAVPCELAPITLDLRNPIPARELKKITVSPRPKSLFVELEDSWDDAEGGRVIAINGIFLPGETYTVTLPADLRDRYGQRLGRRETIKATITRRPELTLSAANATLVAAEERKFGVTARHLQRIEVRVGELNDEQTTALLVGGDRDLTWPSGLRPRTQVFTLDPKGPTEWAAQAIDLRDLVGDRRGAFLVEVRPLAAVPAAQGESLPAPVRGLFRVTDLGPTVHVSQPETLVRIASLGDGAPIAGAQVRYLDTRGVSLELGRSPRDGIVALGPEHCAGAATGAPWCATPRAERGVIIVDGPGDDRAYVAVRTPRGLAEDGAEDGAEEGGLLPGEHLVGRLITERGVYRPGEAVHIVGWTAVMTAFNPSGLRRPRRQRVRFTLRDRRGDPVAEARGRTTAEGKLATTLTLPEGAALGRYKVEATIGEVTLDASLRVEDFRTPEFEVRARAMVPDVIATAGQVVRVRADYYFGGSVTIDRARHHTACSLFHYRPPGLDRQWSVGAYDEHSHYRGTEPTVDLPPTARWARGALEFPVATEARAEGLAERCRVSVEVRDRSLQAVGAEDTYLIHPGRYYLAIRGPDRRLLAGDRFEIPIRALGFAGGRIAGDPATIAITRTSTQQLYRQENGRRVHYGHREVTEEVVTCEVRPTASGDDPTCDPGVLKTGRYRVIARAQPDGHAIRSEATFGVHDPPKHRSTWAATQSPRLELRTSARELRPGERVAVEVRSPWSDLRHGLLLVERDGIREHRPLIFKDGAARVDLEADDTWTPHVAFEAVAVRGGDGGQLPRIERARGDVRQDPAHRRLEVALTAPSVAGPGDEVAIQVAVRDQEGRPTAGRVALWVVDEAILALTEYAIPDLLATFIPRGGRSAASYDAFATLRRAYFASPSDPWLDEFGGMHSVGGSGSGYGAGGTAGGVVGGVGKGAPAARSRFETTPLFLADLAVGASGSRRAKVTLPDNLTTFRILAVASARLIDGESPGRFGTSDARLRVTKDLVLRPALPRILRPGDRAEVAAIVQNRGATPGEVEVWLTIDGGDAQALTVVSPAQQRIPIAADGQVRIPFTIDAKRPGAPTMRLRAVFKAGDTIREDAVELPLEITPERTLIERVAAYGTVTDDTPIGVPLRMPSGVLPGFGGVMVSTTSTLLGGVEDAVHALIDYPYGCLEQVSSRLLPLVAISELGDLGRGVPLPQGIDVKAMAAEGIDRLLAMQTTGGGFSYWPGGQDPHAYASAYATWVLSRAAAAGYTVPEAAMKRALDYLEGVANAEVVDSRLHPLGELHRVFAVHTLTAAGRGAAVAAVASRLYDERAALPLFARAFLLQALARSEARDPRVKILTAELLGELAETEAAAHAKEPVAVDLSGVFHSDGRSDAIILSALLQVKPDHPVIPKLARGILDRRAGGVWRNTQENAYALLALAEYAAVSEREVPDFVARAWIGGTLTLDAVFRGREGAARQGRLAMVELLAGLGHDPQGGDLLPIVLQRQGKGRLYYRIGAEWAPLGIDLPPRSQGLAIERRLRRSTGIVGPQEALPPGESVALDLEVRADNRTAFVAIELPLPAGLEAIQRELGRGQAAMTLRGIRGAWVSHEEQRRDRVVVFADDLQPGVHHHTVHLRATTPGSYTMPPAVIEAMYTPELYGRSAAARIEVAAP